MAKAKSKPNLKLNREQYTSVIISSSAIIAIIAWFPIAAQANYLDIIFSSSANAWNNASLLLFVFFVALLLINLGIVIREKIKRRKLAKSVFWLTLVTIAIPVIYTIYFSLAFRCGCGG